MTRTVAACVWLAASLGLVLAPAMGQPPGGGRRAPGGSEKKADLKSVIKGKPAGIEVGQYAPDFTLEPIKPYAELEKWLGDKAPKSAKDKVMLSDLVGKKDVLLLFGSYT